MKKSKKVFLASKSPRRKDILTELEIDFELVDSDYEENNFLDIDPIKLAKKHAKGKAKGALKNLKDIKKGIILGADTFVELDGKVIGKPISKEDAKNMLKNMSGRTHKVITGICMINLETKNSLVETDETNVTFIDISEDVLDKYLEVAVYMDKAGAYAIQGEASVFVEKIEGSYSNIIGLSKSKVLEMLHKLD